MGVSRLARHAFPQHCHQVGRRTRQRMWGSSLSLHNGKLFIRGDVSRSLQYVAVISPPVTVLSPVHAPCPPPCVAIFTATRRLLTV